MKTIKIEFDLSKGYDHPGVQRLFQFFGNVESFEATFNCEFSCGDGKFLSELSDDELEKYDGYVDWTRLSTEDGEYHNDKLEFVFDYDEDFDEINNAEIRRLK